MTSKIFLHKKYKLLFFSRSKNFFFTTASIVWFYLNFKIKNSINLIQVCNSYPKNAIFLMEFIIFLHVLFFINLSDILLLELRSIRDKRYIIYPLKSYFSKPFITAKVQILQISRFVAISLCFSHFCWETVAKSSILSSFVLLIYFELILMFFFSTLLSALFFFCSISISNERLNNIWKPSSYLCIHPKKNTKKQC